MKPNLPPKILLALLLAGVTTNALADAGVVSRSYCYWGTKKYVAETKGKNCWSIQVERATDRGCNWAESWVELYFCTGPNVRKGEATPYQPYSNGNPFTAVLGTAQARIDDNSASTYSFGGYGGYAYNDDATNADLCTNSDYICMGSQGAGLLFPATSPALNPTSRNGALRSALLDVGKREYDASTRTMVVHGLHARLRNNPYDRINEFSALHLSVLRSADNKGDSLNYNNDQYYLKNLLVSSRAMLNNGKLTLEGALREARVTMKDSAGYQIAELVLDEVRLQVPTEVNPNEVTLQLGSDVGMLSAGVSPRYMPGGASLVREVAAAKAGETLEFSNYPNPVTAGTTATVEARTATTEQVTIVLYGADGRLVRSVYSGLLKANTLRSFPLSLRGISAGIYYLRLDRKGSRLTRRVVVQ